jgi:predicted molibdopterin-dependent oxidoreductase YjgC
MPFSRKQTGTDMFTPIGSSEATITIFLDDRPMAARDGESIATCLLRSGVAHFRTTPVSGSPRLPYCMIGHCFECLVEIDGIGSRQACLLQVRAGMHVRTQNGPAVIPAGSPQ